MSLSKAEIDRIDNDTKHVIFGFVRRVQNCFPSQNTFYIIPELVSFLILSYYYGSDCFNKDLCGSQINISNDGKMIDNDNGKPGHYSSVYGTTRIDSMSNSKYIWRFQTLGPKRTYYLNFGIDSTEIKEKDLEKTFYAKRSKAVYVYYTGGYKYSWEGVEEGDLPKMRDGNEILTMKLQFKKGEPNGSLSISINECEEVLLFNNVCRERNLYYRMAVCCSGFLAIKVKLLS